jgi:hypothetical protein
MSYIVILTSFTTNCPSIGYGLTNLTIDEKRQRKSLPCWWFYIQGESKKTDTFDIQMNNKGVSFF